MDDDSDGMRSNYELEDAEALSLEESMIIRLGIKETSDTRFLELTSFSLLAMPVLHLTLELKFSVML